MKNISKKIISGFLALVMMLGIISNVQITKAESHKTKVKIHKVLMNKTDFKNFSQEEADKVEKYNGGEIQNLKGYFGQSAKAIDGVAFRVFKEVENTVTNAKAGNDPTMPAGLKADKFYVEVRNTQNDGAYLTANGGIAEVTLEDGKYIIVEDKVASTYHADGNELTDEKAIPFELELPLTKLDGTGLFSETDPLHVYPKNTEDKPEVEKDFADEPKKANGTREVNIGDDIPYVVTTKVPQKSEYKTLKWTDTMVKGLDFKMGSLEVSSDQVQLTTADYKITETKRGFILELTESGLQKVEEAAKTQDVVIKLNYKGILNDSALIATEIPNEVKLDYGNRPGVDSTPKPGKPNPNTKKITVTKTWEGTAPQGTAVTFEVYEKETGKLVDTIVLNAGETTKESKELDPEKEYLVIEKAVTGYLPEYTDPTNGTFGVQNKKNPNPEPLKPEPPKVITYGKRFIKIEQAKDTEKLYGAEFIVKNAEGKFLALKENQAAEVQAYNEAEKEYNDAVKNNAQDIAAKKEKRDKAYEKMNMQWEFVSSEANAYKFVSGADGKFEIKGLKKGTYNLKETKAPEGYALLQDEIAFVVDENSWTDAQGIDGHTKVENKKVTIPQTGGMGTVIFTVVGLTIMGGAILAMRRRKEQ